MQYDKIAVLGRIARNVEFWSRVDFRRFGRSVAVEVLGPNPVTRSFFTRSVIPQVPEGRQERQAATGPTRVRATPPKLVGASVALVQPQAGGDRRPAAQVPAQRVQSHRGRLLVAAAAASATAATAAAAADQLVGQPVVRHRVQVPLRAAVQDRGGDEHEQATRGRAQGRATGEGPSKAAGLGV